MGQPGVLHGVRTYILQSKAGQIIETHSISAGLDYPGVGPEHAWLKDSGRAEYVVATDEEALRGFRMLTQREGIIPGYFFYTFLQGIFANRCNLSALESSHAIWEAMKIAKTLSKDKDLVVVSLFFFFFTFSYFSIPHPQCLSGRGDKDVEQISDLLPKWADILDWHVSPHAQSGVKKT